MVEFAKRLRLARRWAKLTQQQLADLVKVHKNTISDLERGRNYPGFQLGCAIGAVLRVNIRWLAGQVDDPVQGIQLPSALERQNFADYSKMSRAEQLQFAEFMADFLRTRKITGGGERVS